MTINKEKRHMKRKIVVLLPLAAAAALCTAWIASSGTDEPLPSEMVMMVATLLRKYIPLPAARPIAETIHRLAAVVRPRIVKPSCRMVPAPRKPMPLTTWAAIRAESRRWPISSSSLAV